MRGKLFTEEELEYLCKFWKHDGAELVAAALNRDKKVLKTKFWQLKKSGKFDYYKNLNKYFV